MRSDWESLSDFFPPPWHPITVVVYGLIACAVVGFSSRSEAAFILAIPLALAAFIYGRLYQREVRIRQADFADMERDKALFTRHALAFPASADEFAKWLRYHVGKKDRVVGVSNTVGDHPLSRWLVDQYENEYPGISVHGRSLYLDDTQPESPDDIRITFPVTRRLHHELMGLADEERHERLNEPGAIRR